MASSVLMTVSRDEEERARIMRDEKIELDYQSYMTYAKEEGHAKGFAKGHVEGHAEGHTQGRAEGIAIGAQKTQAFVLQLIEQGLSANEIKQRLESA